MELKSDFLAKSLFFSPNCSEEPLLTEFIKGGVQGDFFEGVDFLFVSSDIGGHVASYRGHLVSYWVNLYLLFITAKNWCVLKMHIFGT